MPKILIIDDNALERKITVACVSDLGYAVQQADDGAEAIELLDRDPADVIITDINMAGINGMQLIAYCKRNFKSIPIIAISGYVDIVTYSQMLKEYAVFDAFNKPIDLERLELVLQSAVTNGN